MSATTTGDSGMTVKLIGACEAARILGVHRNTIRHWAQDGILRARVLPTGARRFDPDEVERVRAQIHPLAEHPLAHEPGLLDVLADLEARGLVERELSFRLTREGRERLAGLADSSTAVGCAS